MMNCSYCNSSQYNDERMMVYKCDECGKEMEGKKGIDTLRVRSPGALGELMFCDSCGSDILAILQAKHLLKNDKAS